MNEKSIPHTNHWIRKIVGASAGRRLVLHDHRTQLDGSVTIEDGRILRADVAGRPIEPVDFLPSLLHTNSPPNDESTWRIVCHINTADRPSFAANPDPLSPGFPLFPAEITGQKVIALQATTSDSLPDDRIVHHTHADNDFVWLSMKSREAYKKVSDWLGQFLELSFDDAKILATLQSRSQVTGELEYLEERYSKLLNVILPGSVDAPLALRLLCEAWLYTSGEESKVESGIMIHAPQNLIGWLRPFATDDYISTKERVIEAMDKSQREIVRRLFGSVEALDSALDDEAKSEAKSDLASAVSKVANPTLDN